MGQDEGTERILSKMVAWATARDDLRGIAVVGSRARSDHPADAWSDLDVLLIARRLNRGLRMVLDKDGIARHLESGGLPAHAPIPPSQEEFSDVVSRFWNEQVWVALKMRRGELFVAKTLGESRLLALLLRMIEWHAQVTTDHWSPVYDHGRFLGEWAAPEVVSRLHTVFPRYNASEILNARIAALDLFRHLAEETAARLGYAYPRRLEDTVMSWVRAQQSDGGRPTSR